MRSFLYIHSFLCWCIGAVLRSPLRPSAKRWDTSPAGGGKCTGVNRGEVCGKAKPQKRLSYHKVSLYLRACTWLPLRGSWREAPERGAKKRPFPGAPCICIIFVKMNFGKFPVRPSPNGGRWPAGPDGGTSAAGWRVGSPVGRLQRLPSSDGARTKGARLRGRLDGPLVCPLEALLTARSSTGRGGCSKRRQPRDRKSVV